MRGLHKLVQSLLSRLFVLTLSALLMVGAAAQAAEPIKIGFGVSLTGGLASSGKAHLLAMQIWAEEVNAKGGLLGRPLQIIYYDDQTNTATVPAIYAKLLDVDKVDLLVGHATNLIVAALPMIIQRKKMVMTLLAYASNVQLKYPRYFQSAPFGGDYGEISKNFFEVAKTIKPEPKTVALVGADAEFSNNVLTGARATPPNTIWRSFTTACIRPQRSTLPRSCARLPRPIPTLSLSPHIRSTRSAWCGRRPRSD